MKYVLPFYLLLLLASCQLLSGNSWKEKIVLSIIVEHFNDRVILQELTPIVKYEIWSKGRTSSQRLPNGRLTEIPPPPPIDTIVYGDYKFGKLLQEKILTIEECDWMKRKLEHFPKPFRLSPSPELDIDLVKTSLVYRSDRKNELKKTYYRISTPLFNEAKTKVLISVDSFNGPASLGYFYVFEQEGEHWKMIYKKQTWIT